MLGGSRITGGHIQFQVPGSFPESDILTDQGEARTLCFQQAPQQSLWCGHSNHWQRHCSRRSQGLSFSPAPCSHHTAGSWVGGSQGWEGSEGTFFTHLEGFLHFLVHQPVTLRKSQGSSVYPWKGRWGGILQVMIQSQSLCEGEETRQLGQGNKGNTTRQFVKCAGPGSVWNIILLRSLK